MKLRLFRAMLLFLSLIPVAAVAVLAQDNGEDVLFKVRLQSHRDAEAVIQSGGKAVLRSGNTYLVSGKAQALADVRLSGVDCDSLSSGFRRDDWVLLSSHDPSVASGFVRLSLGTEAILNIDGQMLVRRESAAHIMSQDDRIEIIRLPEFEVPIKYIRSSPLRFSLGETDLLDSIASMVSEDSLESYVRRLEAFVTRSTASDSILAARDWLVSKFQSLGCEVVIDSFSYASAPYGDYAFNVVADHTGTSAKETYIIVCGHFDSTSNNPLVLAPGADDNASGTAMCLEIARVLNGFDTPKTVRFICFSGEEQGLLGSAAYVNRNRNLNIEAVLNGDMIAYNTGSNRRVNMFCKDDGRAHAELIGGMVATYGSLVASYGSYSGNSDHWPFNQAGFRALFAHEYIFNSPNYHSTHDIADNCSFSYMTKIVKGCAAGVYAITQAPPVVEGFETVDLGKGDKLLARWDAIDDLRDFDIILRLGTFPGDSSFKYVVPQSDTSFLLTDLAENVEYFASAAASMDGSESIVWTEASGIPLSIPEAPTSLRAMPGYKAIELRWTPSPQIDVVGYKVMRSIRGLSQFSYVATADSGFWADSLIDPETYYDYYLIAVDEDSNESEPTTAATSRGAFFDHALLVLIETGKDAIDTTIAFPRYRSSLANIEHVEYVLPMLQPYMSIEELGQYRSLFWICDGLTDINGNMAAIDWLRKWGANIMIAGPPACDQVVQSGGDWYGVRSIEYDFDPSFSGAVGIDGWPDAVIDTSVKSLFNEQGAFEHLRFVRVFDYDSLASSGIHRYQSTDTLDYWHNRSCGLYSSIDTNKLVLLGFPLFHLEPQSAKSIMEYAADLFGVPRGIAGDVNDDGRFAIQDVLRMIRMLFLGEPMPADVNWLDVNSDCEFNIVDVLFLISFIYLGGPSPSYGCAGN